MKLSLTENVTRNQLTYIERRYEQALWYAFGIEDYSGERVACMEFANYCATEAYAYATHETSSLAGVSAQWEAWTTSYHKENGFPKATT